MDTDNAYNISCNGKLLRGNSFKSPVKLEIMKNIDDFFV